MILMMFEIEYDGILDKPPRRWRAIKRQAFVDGGKKWHSRFAKRHFTHKGAKLYGYTPRKGDKLRFRSKTWRSSYQGRKHAKYKHTLPLVYSGDSRRDVLTKWRVQGHRDGSATVHMNAPGLNRRSSHTRINMRHEMETVIPSEERVLGGDIQAAAERGLKKSKRRYRRKKRIRG